MPEDHSASDDPVQRLLREAKLHGLETAQTTNDQDIDDARVAIAKDHWNSQVELIYQGKIDADASQADAALMQGLNQSVDRERRAATQADAGKRKAAETQEAVPAPEPPPVAPSAGVLFATLALGATFSMSTFELPVFSALEDTEMRLAVSGGMGVLIAATSIFSLYNIEPYQKDASVVKPKRASTVWQVTAGLFMILAFGAMRMATSGDDWMLTIGLMGIDGGLLLYAKNSAAQFRNKVDVHAERNDARLQKQKAAEDALKESHSFDNALTQAQAELRAAKQRRDARLLYDFDLETVKQAACAAWMEGYAAGLDQNRKPRDVAHAALHA